MRRRFGGLPTSLWFAGLIGVAAVMPAGRLESRMPRAMIAPGIYSSVSESPNTGDLGGLEVEIGKAGQIETVLCEGWCNETDRTTYARRGGSIVYDLHMRSVEPGGRITVDTLKVELRPSGRNVLAKVQGDERWRVLKPRPRLYGLSIAHDNMEAMAKAKR
jgi:hypothetical protein